MEKQLDSQTKQQKVFINPAAQHQVFDGWGTSLCWWSGQIGNWSEQKRSAIMEDVFGETGLKINKVRYNIGGGENPKHNHMTHSRDMEGFINRDGNYDWSKDKGQRWVARNCLAKGVNEILAFNNSAPWFMTKSECSSGSHDATSDNLKPEHEQAFIDYLVNVTDHLKKEDGIDITKIDVVNEPLSSWWRFGGSQEGMHVSAEQQMRLIKAIRKELDKKGHDNIKVVASDTWSVDEMVELIEHKLDKDTKDIVARYDFHTYGGSQRYEMAAAARRENKPHYMSEFCSGSKEHTHKAMNSSIAIAEKIVSDIKDSEAKSWYIWQAIESEEENVTKNEDWGLMHGVYRDFSFNGKKYHKEDYFKSKQYFTMGQFSKFIPEGSRIIGANNDNILAAFDEKNKRAIIVAINPDNKPANYAFDLSSFSQLGEKTSKIVRTSEKEDWTYLPQKNLENKNFNDILPAQSIITYIIDDAEYLGMTGILFDGNNHYKIINENSEKALSVICDNLHGNASIRQWNFGTDSCVSDNWKISPSGDGKTYTICNKLNGKYLAISQNSFSNGELLTQHEDSSLLSAKWLIIDNGNNDYRLINAFSGKSPTIENWSKTNGAKVNQWTFSKNSNSLWRIEKVELEKTLRNYSKII